MVGGPDAGRVIRLRAGRRSLGRAPGGLVVDDPAIEPHHVVLEVAEGMGGGVRCVQVAGRAPVLVDNDRLVPCDVLRDGALIRIGNSLLRLRRAGAGIGDDDPVAQESDGRWAVTIGVGDVCVVAPNVALQVGPPHELAFDQQVAFDAGCRRIGVSITTNLARLGQLGVVGVHRMSVARSIVSAVVSNSTRPPGVVSLVPDVDAHVVAPVGGGAGLIVVSDVDGIDVARHAFAGGAAGDGRLLIVLADEGGRLPPDCHSVLTVGETWRGTFVGDVASGFDDVVRLHVAGCTRATATSRLAASGRGDRPFVAQEVPRPGAEFGGRVVGVPQTACGERQATAPDARVELVSHPGEDLDLLVEARPPRRRETLPILGGRGAMVRQ